MPTVVIIGFVLLAIILPVAFVKRDVLGKTLKRKRHRSPPPFLFFPTSGRMKNATPTPAWYGAQADMATEDGGVIPEPGIADLPPESERDGVMGDRRSHVDPDRRRGWEHAPPG